MKQLLGWAAQLFAGMTWALVAVHPALAGDPTKELLAANRLACGYVQGVVPGFAPQGRVTVKPSLTPDTPGLTIAIVDRSKGRAVLEEDGQETAGAFLTSAAGLTIMARYPDGGTTLVTVYPIYLGASDVFPLVTSRHGAGSEPHISQRYGFCRPAQDAPAAPVPAPPTSGHGK